MGVRHAVIVRDSDLQPLSGIDGSVFESFREAVTAVIEEWPDAVELPPFDLGLDPRKRAIRNAMNEFAVRVATNENDESVWILVVPEAQKHAATETLKQFLALWQSEFEEANRPKPSLGLTAGQPVKVWTHWDGWVPGVVVDPSQGSLGDIRVEYTAGDGSKQATIFQSDGSSYTDHYRLKVGGSGCMVALFASPFLAAMEIFKSF